MAEGAAAARLFFALWPSPALQERLAAWAQRAAGEGRAMRAEKLHLTLAFLGATERVRIPALIALASEVRFAPFRLALDEIGYWKHNRILWCGARAEPAALAALVAALRARLAAARVPFDPKPFVSHVTLVRNAAGPPASPNWIPLAWEAADFALIESVQSEGRIEYRRLARFPAQPDAGH